MASGSVLPPDVRESMQKSGGGRGVGGGAPENERSSQSRTAAMSGQPSRVEDEPEEIKPQKEERQPQVEAKTERCDNCKATTQGEWNFCAKCGKDLLKRSAADRLGIKFTDEDIESYLFRGYILKDVEIVRGHKMTVKSSQAADLSEVDDFIMNGSWAKDDDGNERKVSDFYLRQMNSLAVTASCVHRIDGTPIGGTLVEKVNYFLDKGSAFVDMVGERVNWFNQAITDYLKKEDLVEGS